MFRRFLVVALALTAVVGLPGKALADDEEANRWTIMPGQICIECTFPCNCTALPPVIIK